jgi:hypothetical protein
MKGRKDGRKDGRRKVKKEKKGRRERKEISSSLTTLFAFRKCGGVGVLARLVNVYGRRRE